MKKQRMKFRPVIQRALDRERERARLAKRELARRAREAKDQAARDLRRGQLAEAEAFLGLRLFGSLGRSPKKKNCRRVLSSDAVADIQVRAAIGLSTAKQLAEDFGVSLAHIYRIVNRQARVNG